ncbi:hypothetical protein LY78DRAFT_729655 [Colletotrichum sublineola]|uniref:Uncharacterized protein n=1 Tax=Colletotrichum sublineola TaxID=1173701 RepID=A0A066XFL6_COLSU|nr:hypothetical protein LY78DRAFT_729655 [Colletotrichum sublineola]KDN67983.1 hypothetical protein CSUB01_12521 [Colletotrichum sublineola]
MKFTLTSIAILLVGVASAAPALDTRAFGDNAISLQQANTGKFEPGTPVVDGALKLKDGESCTTTSTKGVLGCDDGTGGTFNIVDGKRQ